MKMQAPAAPWKAVSFPRRILAGCAGLAILSSGCGSAEEPAAKSPTRARIEVSITPGKPGAPTETAIASLAADKATLAVKRSAAGDSPAEETVALSSEEFLELWKIVRKNELLTFKPQIQSGQVFDAASHTLVIEAGGQDGADHSHASAQWDAPLKNEAAVKPLISALSALAKKHSKNVQLVYFP